MSRPRFIDSLKNITTFQPRGLFELKLDLTLLVAALAKIKTCSQTTVLACSRWLDSSASTVGGLLSQIWRPSSFAGAFLCLFGTMASSAQNTVDTGLLPYHVYQNGNIDHINLDNQSLTVSIPLVSYPQRGSQLAMSFSLVFSGPQNTASTVCELASLPGSSQRVTRCDVHWAPPSLVGGSTLLPVTSNSARGVMLVDTQEVDESLTSLGVVESTGTLHTSQVVWLTADGGAHPAGPLTNGTGQIALDGSGYQNGVTYSLSSTSSNGTPTCHWLCSESGLIAVKDGVSHFTVGQGPSTANGPILRMDADGNYITRSSTQYVDTAGRAIPLPTLVSSPTAAQISSCGGPLPVASVATWSPPGYAEPFLFCFANVTLALPWETVFIPGSGSSGITSITNELLQSVVLPNGQMWSFQYGESLNQYGHGGSVLQSGINTGDLTQITFPTGGTLQYSYALSNTTGTVVAGSTNVSEVAARTLNANDGNGPQTWTYSPIANPGQYSQTGSVTDPLGNVTSLSLAKPVPSTLTNAVRTTTTADSTGKVWQTVTETYPWQYATSNGFPLYPSSRLTTLENGQSSLTTFTYCCDLPVSYLLGSGTPAGGQYYWDVSNGKITDESVYDYASGATGTLLRNTTTSYQFQSNTNYSGSSSFFDLPAQVSIYNGSGTLVGQKTYGYDGSSRASSGITEQIGTPLFSVFGHLTSETNWLNTGSSSPMTQTSYFDTGEPYQSIDPMGHPTTFGYSATYAGSLLTSTNNALGQPTTNTYVAATGQPLSVMDANGATTSYSYQDPLNRLTKIVYPSVFPGTSTQGESDFQYNDTGTLGATVTDKITPSVSKQTQVIVDGVGRTLETLLLSDPAGRTYTRTSYDALGRTSQVWNPTRCNPMTQTSCAGEPTWGITTHQYDALSREVLVIPPDGTASANNEKTLYSGNTTTVTDQAGVSRQSTTDALGRLTQVTEVNPGWITQYQYDALGNLTCVEQHGGVSGTGCSSSANNDATSPWRVRRFTYDSLSRLLTSNNPETGKIAYSYDANGNVLTKTSPLPNQTGLATVTATHSYDALNRLLSTTYSDGVTPSNYYGYDVAPSWMPNLTNTVGRLVNSSNQYGGIPASSGTATTYSYDAMGRVVQEWEQTPSISPGGAFVLSSYDLAGNLLSTTHPTSLVLSYVYDAANRLSSVTSSANDTQHPPALYSVDSSLGYWADGSIRKASFGNGLTETSVSNIRLQPCRHNVNVSNSYLSHCTDGMPSGTTLDFTLAYNLGNGDNGNLATWTATGQQSFGRSYTYDTVNRIWSMADSASGQSCKGMSWAIDAWGNTTAQTPTAGSCPSFSSSASTSNQLAGFQYDAAGNLSSDGFHNYRYDAEGRILQVDGGSTASYIYNENGKRVRKSASGSWTEYFYAPDGSVLDEDSNGNSWSSQYVYAGGRLIANYTNGTTEFMQTDHLGSTRLVTSVSGGVVDNIDYEPFGQQISGGATTSHKFTGKERDAESGLDYFGARYLSSSMGRFTSPDPFLNSGHPDDPQTWNRYSYALNNPLKIVDPTGLYNLVNTCASGDDKCNKAFNQNAANLKAGLAALNKALDDPATAKALGEAAVVRLSQGLAAMGTENDGNNVDVKFGATGDGAAANTIPHYNGDSDSYRYTVTFDPSKNSGATGYAINADHEGMHAYDYTNYMRGAATTESPFQQEYRGYQNSGWAAQALGVPNISFRGTQIWNQSWGAVDRQTLMDKGITKVVTDKDHPESQPHNPNTP